MESILNSTKKLLGIREDDTNFDQDIIIHINSVFSILNRLGAGPENGFFIKDKTTNWNDYIDGDNKIELIKTYMYLKVKLVFDPPTSTSVLTSINESIKEYEWTINHFVDVKSNLSEEEFQND